METFHYGVPQSIHVLQQQHVQTRRHKRHRNSTEKVFKESTGFFVLGKDTQCL